MLELEENVRVLSILLRLCTVRRLSSDDWVRDEWLSTMGAGLWTSMGTAELNAFVGGDTGKGGDNELVGSVERVRLSKNGGGGRKCLGGNRAGAGGWMGLVIASDNEWRSGEGGVEVLDGAGDTQRKMGRRGGMFVSRPSRRSASESLVGVEDIN